MINKTNLDEAVAEARRFLDKAEELTTFDYGPSKEHAAVLRASMDMTRVLAKMRAK